ncbi:MAG: pyrimidine dimer DNA glycosylase/endonuclease V [Candidatus Aceula meridiana]|nr:pyrimidine dimer DNA glycosylase/endonuclease V [Candidatus Aceula meridiana]
MRIWDISPKYLCRSHLLGEHRELHAIWIILSKNKKGYSRHPETLRWKGKLKALYVRHEKLVLEMQRRGYRHLSPLDKRQAKGIARQTQYVDSIKQQRIILLQKKCNCKIS